MKKMIVTILCATTMIVASAFDNPNDKWVARRQMQDIHHANMAQFNNAMGGMAMQAMFARMAQGSGNFRENPQVLISQQIGALDPASRQMLIGLIYARIKLLINTGNIAEADRVFGLVKLALQNHDPQFIKNTQEIAAMFQTVRMRMMRNGGFL